MYYCYYVLKVFTAKSILKLYKYVVCALVVAIFSYLSISDLNIDTINPDGINWHTRSTNFYKAIKTKHYSDTFQAYHPGVTLMWLSNIGLYKYQPMLSDNPKSDELKLNFLERDYAAKFSVVVLSTLVFASTYLVLWRVISFNFATIFSLMFTLEPFLVGMRRLYHLDYLLTILIFLTFLFVMSFNYVRQNWFLLPVAGLFFALSLLTKSTALILLPALPFIFLLGNGTLPKKVLGFAIFIVFSALFTYSLFPALWKHPQEVVQNIFSGITDIGIDGKKEIGSSGKTENITLDETVGKQDNTFYITSLFVRLSIFNTFILIVAAGYFIFVFGKGLLLTILTRPLPKRFDFSKESWLAFWSICFAVYTIVVLSLSVKKLDRYEVLIFPFLLIVITYFFTRFKYGYILVPVFVVLTAFQLYKTHPYYIAYSNPLLGGLETRLRVLDDSPFGIGTYESFNIVKNDMAAAGYTGFYTISGSKAIRAISINGKYSRFPSCVTDYVIVYAFEDKPTYTCTNKYAKIGVVDIDGFDYWHVYKRINQKHENNYD